MKLRNIIRLSSCVAIALTLFIATFTSPAQAQGPNIVQNGDFETGDLTGWTQTGSVFVSTTTANSPTHSAAFGAVGTFGSLTQTLSTVANQDYQLTFFLASDGAQTNEFQVLADGNLLLDQSNVPSQSFTQYTFDFTASTMSTDIQFNGRNDPGFLYLDDVSVNSISSVPEGNSALILLSGILPLGWAAWRKRRVAVK